MEELKGENLYFDSEAQFKKAQKKLKKKKAAAAAAVEEAE